MPLCLKKSCWSNLDTLSSNLATLSNARISEILRYNSSGIVRIH